LAPVISTSGTGLGWIVQKKNNTWYRGDCKCQKTVGDVVEKTRTPDKTVTACIYQALLYEMAEQGFSLVGYQIHYVYGFKYQMFKAVDRNHWNTKRCEQPNTTPLPEDEEEEIHVHIPKRRRLNYNLVNGIGFEQLGHSTQPTTVGELKAFLATVSDDTEIKGRIKYA
jgi:hypothetical protein